MAEAPKVALATEITLDFADGEYPFCLRLRWIDELQCKLGVGIGTVYARLYGGDFFIGDIVETIRFGLIGGGMPSVTANKMIETWVDGMPIAKPGDPSSPLAVAQVVIAAAFHAVPKNLGGDGGKAPAATKDGSTSRPSTAKPSKGASGRAKRATTRSRNGSRQAASTPS